MTDDKRNRDREGAVDSDSENSDRRSAASRGSRSRGDTAVPAWRRDAARGGWPAAFFITFRTYGTWLHGDPRGSVDREHNTPGAPLLPANAARECWERAAMRHAPVTLDRDERGVVRRTALDVMEHQKWRPHALAVRSNHVHVVVSASNTPERVMNTLKSWCTRRLVEAGRRPRGAPVWARHGSTRYLWDEDELHGACAYVRYGQGDGA